MTRPVRTITGLVLEISEQGHSDDGRVWYLSYEARRCGFTVTLTGRELRTIPPSAQPIRRDFTEDEIERAILSAVERFMLTTPHLTEGSEYEIALRANDLYEAAGSRI